MRVCLISPGHLSTNPRLVKEAQALSAAGHAVSVICGRYTPWGWKQDQALIDPRWRVSHVPFGPAEAPKLTYLAQTIRRRVATTLVRAGMSTGPIVEAAHGPVGPALLRVATAMPADLYVAHYVAALPAAAAAARKYGAAYAFDAEDFHLGDAPNTPDNALARQIILDIEGRHLPGASYLTAASPMIADAYAESYGVSRPKVVLNVFPRGNAPSSPSAHGTAIEAPSLYWFSQTIGPSRGLETAIEAIARARSAPHLYLRGAPAAGYVETLRALASAHGVVERLHFLQPEAPNRMERLCAEFDLGYAGETTETENGKFALANKLFSYLLGGVPILASDTPAHRSLAPELGEAMSVFPIGDAAALAAALDRLLLDPHRLAAARAHAWQLGQERFCWEVEQRVLLEAVNAVQSRSRLNAA